MPYVPARDGRKNRRSSGRAPAVPISLDDMHGHRVGVLELPHHMAPGHRSRRRFDLDDPAQLRLAYQSVLCEAADCCEINDLLNPGTLRRVWRSLHLPGKVRAAWESRHPALENGAAKATAARGNGIFAEDVVAARMGGDRLPRGCVPASTGQITGRQMIAARTNSTR
ncbi:hypothetical protein [Symbioplanes lichenis]|uniref:hypothetical protein n=1 Tax=Symbioplanes lichenis TaxID=1629072 RepID=UPI0027394638|nr:hypothetical protein [Actinoplanes lichenis]